MNTDYSQLSRMTMDVHHHRNVTTASSSPSSRYSPPTATTDMVQQVTSLPAVALHQRPQKRSFDVAFLMAPDDLSKRRPRPLPPSATAQPVARSAFTKVVSPDPPLAPSPASSPATPPLIEFSTYLHQQHQQHECSLSPPLPPAAAHFMSPFPLGFRTPFAMMMPSRSQPTAAGCKDYPSPLQPLQQQHQQQHQHQHQHQHQQHQQQQHQHQQSLPSPSPLQFGPAAAAAVAALPAMLLPASIAAAALTLPSQNVCAKCNVSFRMTSDLVYHMRSHHKGDGGGGGLGGGLGGLGGTGVGGSGGGADAKKRRDMDKLRCPVCDESFRERHHLTRHMTAHQDKEGDRLDDEDDAPVHHHHHHHQQQQQQQHGAK